jgi:hypothetical protein
LAYDLHELPNWEDEDVALICWLVRFWVTRENVGDEEISLVLASGKFLFFEEPP